MSETPKDNNNPESSTIYPFSIDEIGIKSFVLEAKPIRQLKLAIESLSDSEFNEDGKGRIDVTEDGLQITVRKSSHCIGHVLLLAKADVIIFRFYKALEGKIVQLNEISENLIAEYDDDPFNISHDLGSTDLVFVFGKATQRRGFVVELFDNTAEMPKFPSPISFCEAIVPSVELRNMLPHLVEDTICQLVSVHISDKSAIIMVGENDDEGRTWKHLYDPKKVGVLGMAPEQKHFAQFYWPYVGALEKASQLAPAFLLCLLLEPPNNIMLKFPLLDLGRLEYIKTAYSIIPNVPSLTQPGSSV